MLVCLVSDIPFVSLWYQNMDNYDHYKLVRNWWWELSLFERGQATRKLEFIVLLQGALACACHSVVILWSSDLVKLEALISLIDHILYLLC